MLTLINILFLDMVLYSIHAHISVNPNFDWCKNYIIFAVDNSLSTHTDQRKKNILALGVGPTQKLDNSTIKTQAHYSINLRVKKKRFCFSLHGNGSMLMM